MLVAHCDRCPASRELKTVGYNHKPDGWFEVSLGVTGWRSKKILLCSKCADDLDIPKPETAASTIEDTLRDLIYEIAEEAVSNNADN